MSSDQNSANGLSAGGKISIAFGAVTLLFFGWGFVTSLIDPLVPAVKSIFELSFLESQLTQFSWFIAYALVSLPAAAVLSRLGSVPSILVALAIMISGCLLAPLATFLHSYPLVLTGLFVIASGVTLLQVAANPLVAAIGDPKHAHFRLTLAQAFNSLGTVLGPPLGAFIMLRGGVFDGKAVADTAAKAESLANVERSFLMIAGVFLLLAFLVFLARKAIVNAAVPAKAASPLEALSSRWAVLGAGAIFLYVGAEVTVGSFMINFLHQPHVLNIQLEEAAKLLAFYWGGAMVGRFVGSALLTRFPAAHLLLLAAATAACLATLAVLSGGHVAAIAALSIGLFNSIMFPVIFTLTLERSTASSAATSGLLCTAIVGGAFLPLLAGGLADKFGLSVALIVPALAYLVIVVFAGAAKRVTPIQQGDGAGVSH
ncbi:glucose/galactose MFS transporter [Candidatus Phycosocius spiralis]|uniref:MFS transporter n=1 Tax=Candidatus Phycosocius spiralis TaxID=2815099 RepID=A0ABQ4PXH7_9PROT|nr:glucose/galactose MFS transporter [Candidatus Phycosocius spiralis]GIU67799.1 MFS transporter [Candidatus Phycosocius spiralis]